MNKRLKKLVSIIMVITMIFLMGFGNLSGSLASPVDGAAGNGSIAAEYAPDQVLVKYVPGTTEDEKRGIKNKFNGKLVKRVDAFDLEVIRIGNGKSVSEVIADIRNERKIMIVQPNYIYYPDVVDPISDDYYAGELWGLNNIGQLINKVPGGVPNIDIDAPEAWRTIAGSSLQEVVVAVIDTGVDISHPDLMNRIWVNIHEIPNNGIDDDGNSYIDDVNGWDFFYNDNSVYDDANADSHGTHVSGTIAAVGNNEIGVIGVASNVLIMPLKFIGPAGGYTADAIEALAYAKNNGAKIANNSWGGGSYDAALKSAIDGFGDVFVAAAGNSNTNTDRKAHYPSSYPCTNIISVAAVDSKGLLASFSNYGMNTVDVAAPGVSILSTLPGNTYAYYSGTSMAAPHVSGIAALLMGNNGTLTTGKVIGLIKGNTMALPSLSGKVSSGGLVNAELALRNSGTDVQPKLSVVSTVPAKGASNVQIGKNITVTFNLDVKYLGTGIKINDEAIQNGITISGKTVTINPSVNLQTNSSYRVTIGTTAVQGISGETMENDYIFAFITGRK